MPYRKNIVSGAVLAFFSITVFMLSLNISTFTGLGAAPLGSAFIPRLWSVCLALLSFSLFFRGIRERTVYVKAGKIKPFVFKFSEFCRKHSEVILTFVSIAVYTALIGFVGFTIMSTLYLFAQILILTPAGKRNFLAAGIVSVVVAVLVDYIFVSLLHVLLPRGILGF
ncbi:MAG: tripartite tricarboxylate transporter TctB family protein [Spirochaetales bacterium]|jgi:putative tricarboxylic transport membrane protein|nr:tripartite tricarboxylate transporter TctB family protein [Spirochaetales bacterium]